MNTVYLGLAITALVVHIIMKLMAVKDKPPKYEVKPLKNEIPEISYKPPDGMTPCLAAYIMNRGYDKKILNILVAYAAVRDLVRVKDSLSYDAMIIETLRPSEDFEILPEIEKNALFILLGDRFLPGRIFRFVPKEIEDFNRINEFLAERLEQASYLYLHAFSDLLGFKKYLEVGEFTRLPEATPEEAPARFIGTRENALEYLPYALAFGLQNKWAGLINSEVIDGSYSVLLAENQRHASAPSGISESDLYDL
ncbi:MAG: DUF2207 domain-containing protein [Elusimicrobia bacterium]|nr:DUF2207 domain-containing protein [Elusimicrobiota bacterium]